MTSCIKIMKSKGNWWMWKKILIIDLKNTIMIREKILYVNESL